MMKRESYFICKGSFFVLVFLNRKVLESKLLYLLQIVAQVALALWI